jgi:hypothetical protein
MRFKYLDSTIQLSTPNPLFGDRISQYKGNNYQILTPFIFFFYPESKFYIGGGEWRMTKQALTGTKIPCSHDAIARLQTPMGW